MADRVTLNSTEVDFTSAAIAHLGQKLGLMFKFKRLSDEHEYVMGSKILSADCRHHVLLFATRHFDGSPGLDFQITWSGQRPSELIKEYRQKVKDALATLPKE